MDFKVPEVTDADVEFVFEDNEIAEIDSHDVKVDIEVVVKGRLRSAAPMSILRDVPLDV